MSFPTGGRLRLSLSSGTFWVKNRMDVNNLLIFQLICPGNFRIQPKAPNLSRHQTSASTINHSIYQTLYLTILCWIDVTAVINMLFYAMLLYFGSSMQSAFNLVCWAEPTKQSQRHLPCTTPKSKFIQRPGTCLKISEHGTWYPPPFMSPLPPEIRHLETIVVNNPSIGEWKKGNFIVETSPSSMACFRGCNHPTVDHHIFSINRRWLGSCCTVKLNQYVMWINLASLSIKLMHWSRICKWRDFQKLSHTGAGNDFPNSKLANKSRSHHPITSCRGAWLRHSWHWTKSWRQGGVGKACSVGPIWFFNSEDKYQKQMTAIPSELWQLDKSVCECVCVCVCVCGRRQWRCSETIWW